MLTSSLMKSNRTGHGMCLCYAYKVYTSKCAVKT